MPNKTLKMDFRPYTGAGSTPLLDLRNTQSWAHVPSFGIAPEPWDTEPHLDLISVVQGGSQPLPVSVSSAEK